MKWIYCFVKERNKIITYVFVLINMHVPNEFFLLMLEWERTDFRLNPCRNSFSFLLVFMKWLYFLFQRLRYIFFHLSSDLFLFIKLFLFILNEMYVERRRSV